MDRGLGEALAGFNLRKHKPSIPAEPRKIQTLPARRVEITERRVQPRLAFQITDARVSQPKTPADCATKDDVRAEIDRIDQVLLAHLAERHRYVTRMAEIKTDPHEAYDPQRIEAIITKVRTRAETLKLDEDQAELIWRTLINWNVNYEKGIIAARRRAE
jgi:isochorismate pyruvate lyase